MFIRVQQVINRSYAKRPKDKRKTPDSLKYVPLSSSKESQLVILQEDDKLRIGYTLYKVYPKGKQLKKYKDRLKEENLEPNFLYKRKSCTAKLQYFIKNEQGTWTRVYWKQLSG